MRINVYAEELTDEATVVSKTVTDDEFGERTFYGVRLFLKSPKELHHGGEDDDRSAITFWVKWGRVDGNNISELRRALANMIEIIDTKVVEGHAEV